MTSALAKFNLKQTRRGQSDAGIGATMEYNEMIKNVLPSIIKELEEKILDLSKKIDEFSNVKTGVCKCECWEGCQDVKTYDDLNTNT